MAINHMHYVKRHKNKICLHSCGYKVPNSDATIPLESAHLKC